MMQEAGVACTTFTKQIDLFQVYLCHQRQFLFQREIETGTGLHLINKGIAAVFSIENNRRFLPGRT